MKQIVDNVDGFDVYLADDGDSMEFIDRVTGRSLKVPTGIVERAFCEIPVRITTISAYVGSAVTAIAPQA